MFRPARATAGWPRRRSPRCPAASPRSICAATALYEHELMGWLDDKAIGCAISADMSPQLAQCIAALSENHLETRPGRDRRYPRMGRGQLSAQRWHLEKRRGLAAPLSRHTHPPAPGRVARRRQPCTTSASVNSRSDREGGSGLNLIRLRRGKAGTVEHTHDVLMNELAGAALPSQKFGANAAWLRLNVILSNLLSAYKRVGLLRNFTSPDPRGCDLEQRAARSKAIPQDP
jgi:hypothetical protein